MTMNAHPLIDWRGWRLTDADLGEVLNPHIFPMLVRFCFIGVVFSNSIDITRTTQDTDGI